MGRDAAETAWGPLHSLARALHLATVTEDHLCITAAYSTKANQSVGGVVSISRMLLSHPEIAAGLPTFLKHKRRSAQAMHALASNRSAHEVSAPSQLVG